jgi:hypothetical protein
MMVDNTLVGHCCSHTTRRTQSEALIRFGNRALQMLWSAIKFRIAESCQEAMAAQLVAMLCL